MKRVFCLFFALLISLLPIVPAAAETLVTDVDRVYFEVPASGNIVWSGVKQIYCHIWSKNGGELYPWQYEKEKCRNLNNGYWSYNISDIEFDPNDTYSIIFSSDNGQQTYDLSFTSSCKGDIVCCDGTNEKNPIDHDKNCFVAHWRYNGDVTHPAIELDDSGAVKKLNAANSESPEAPWGEYWGNSYELTGFTSATEAATANVQDVTTEAELIASERDGLNTRAVTVWIVVICSVIVLAVVAMTVYLARKNRNN